MISFVPPAVASAAGTPAFGARSSTWTPIARSCAPAAIRAGVLQRVYERLRRRPQRVVFAEGEEEQVIRAAASFVQEGLGTALLVGREDRVRASAHAGH